MQTSSDRVRLNPEFKRAQSLPKLALVDLQRLEALAAFGVLPMKDAGEASVPLKPGSSRMKGNVETFGAPGI